jgi:hypothetical protein
MDDGLGTALPTTIEDRARREQTDNCWDAAEVAQMTVLGRNAAKLLAAAWRTLAALRPKKMPLGRRRQERVGTLQTGTKAGVERLVYRWWRASRQLCRAPTAQASENQEPQGLPTSIRRVDRTQP